jgi:hypothetical protein
VIPEHHHFSASLPPRSFDPASVEALDEPVRRYLNHALAPGAVIADGRRLSMAGRIDVGRWLAFDAEQEMSRNGHGFTWTARAGIGALRPLRVVDRYRLGTGSTEGRLFGLLRFMHADDQNTARSAAGRAAAESIMDPASLLPGNGVSWQAERNDLIVAHFDVPPEHAEVRLRISTTGALHSVEIMRWGNSGQEAFGYVPFGGDIHAERRFGDLVLPSELTIGWWYGTARYRPFFEATIHDAHAVNPAENYGGNRGSRTDVASSDRRESGEHEPNPPAPLRPRPPG